MNYKKYQKLKNLRKPKGFKPPKKCYHRNATIIKFYRKNYPFGRKSKVKHYNPPRMCKKVCNNCGLELKRWKPLL